MTRSRAVPETQSSMHSTRSRDDENFATPTKSGTQGAALTQRTLRASGCALPLHALWTCMQTCIGASDHRCREQAPAPLTRGVQVDPSVHDCDRCEHAKEQGRRGRSRLCRHLRCSYVVGRSPSTNRCGHIGSNFKSWRPSLHCRGDQQRPVSKPPSPPDVITACIVRTQSTA